MDFKEEIALTLEKELSIDKETIKKSIEKPKDKTMGDFAFPCFILAKELHKAPKMIAEELAESINSKLIEIDFLESVSAVNGFLNFTISAKGLAKVVLDEYDNLGNKYGTSTEGNGRNIVIDFSSPNIAKPFHIGHLRSTVIGNALYHIYGHLGYHCVGINHLGDWGTQFGKMLCAYKLWGDRKTIDAGGVQELVKLYVRFHEEAETNPELNDQARAWFSRIEQGDPEAMELYLWMKELTLKEAESVYSMLNIRFDSYAGESFYNDKMDRVVDGLREKGLLKEDQGAQIVDLSEWKIWEF